MTSDNGDVLADVTNKVANANIQNVEAMKRSRDHGWAEPQKYDYETYNAPNVSVTPAPEAVENEFIVPVWASNAKKYEWSDEFGDVGPRVPELERILFGDPDQPERGVDFDK